MKSLRKFAANDLKKNASYNFREKRINLFDALLKTIKKDKIRILDVGGSSIFWEFWGEKIHLKSDIVLINLNKNEISNHSGIVGEAPNLGFIKRNSFDIII